MTKLDPAVQALEKLRKDRSALDKKILDAEKKLIAEAKAAAKSAAAPAKKPAAKKPAAKKPAAKPQPKK